jgi:hypothetical protein
MVPRSASAVIAQNDRGARRSLHVRRRTFTVHEIVAIMLTGRGLPVLESQLATLAVARY